MLIAASFGRLHIARDSFDADLVRFKRNDESFFLFTTPVRPLKNVDSAWLIASLMTILVFHFSF